MTPPYVLSSWHRINAYGEPIRIYIEGDVDSVGADGAVTANPTPKSDFWRQVAAGDPGRNTAYLGQPCQYVQVGCSANDWGSARFSKTAIDSMEQAVLNLMKKAGAKQAVLVGYAGGAQLAGLIAMKHPDKVAQVITVAGVWDYQDWAKHQGLDAFKGSIDLTTWRKKRQKLNQLHFVGEKDEIVPPELARTWSDKVVVVKGATHTKGYNKIYSKIYGEEK
ncbi:MAG: alpha/beta hydrolase [Alphaproteobacteria bacterium]|nr:alpha/beta hydrolase [Alphaproteobacteria bacterium]